MPSRRDCLTTAGAALAGLAGCTSGPPTDGPADSPAGVTDDPDRPTRTPRNPGALDVGGEWRQRGGGPGHAGVTDASGVPENGRARWHIRRVRSSPAVVSDGRLFHHANLGEDTGGTPTKTRTRPPDAGTAHPVYGVAHLVARDPADGSIAWATELPDEGAGWPAVAGDAVVVSTGDVVAAYDAAGGGQRWEHGLGDRPVGEPTVVDDTVVVPLSGVVDGGSGDTIHEPKVRTYALADGRERWTTPVPERGLDIAVGEDVVVAVSHGYDGSGTALGLSLGDGGERWRAPVDGDLFRNPVVVDGAAYVTSGEEVTALSVADGAERWTADGGRGGVAADGDTVYAAGRERLVARDAADGSERWALEPDDGESFVAPAVGDGTVYAGGNWTDLHAVDAADGTARWSHEFPTQTVEGDMVMRGLAAQPAVVDGGVFAFAYDGLYAFGPA
jgi:outer membrane protein assembly factor BamB